MTDATISGTTLNLTFSDLVGKQRSRRGMFLDGSAVWDRVAVLFGTASVFMQKDIHPTLPGICVD